MRAAIIVVLAAGGLALQALPAPSGAALAQGQRSGRRFGPGVCGPIDPAHIRTAEETGGQVLILSPDELSKPGVITTPTRGHAIVIARGEGPRTYSVPVDSSVTHVVFSAWFDGQGGALSVISPDGMTVQERETVHDALLNCGRIVRIDTPAHGRWQLQVAPTNQFWLRADSNGAIWLRRFEFEQAGDDERPSKLRGRLLAGRPASLSLWISSVHGTPSFELVSLDAQRLQEIALEAADEPDGVEEDGDAHFTGTFDLPSGPFRVLVKGTDNRGAEYQRVSDLPFRAEVVEVIPPGGGTLSPGAVHPVTFTVRNLGPAVRLKLVATSGGKVLPVEPAALELEHGAEGLATVRLAVPSDAAGRVDVLLAAEASGEPPTRNYAIQEFTVSR